jgi:hypothetical protein
MIILRQNGPFFFKNLLPRPPRFFVLDSMPIFEIQMCIILIVTKKWNSVPEFHWNIFLFSGIWNYLKGGISGKMPKKWNFGPFFFPEYS